MTGLALAPEHTALVVVDVQEKLATAMPEPERSRVVHNIGALIDAARAMNIPILVTEQYPRGLGSTVAALRERLLEANAEFVEKTEFDVCRNAECAERIDRWRRRSVVLTGLEAHICIFQSARGLVARNLATHVPIDATCSRNLENRRIAEGLWSRAGAIPTSTETVLFDLIGVGSGETFKRISKLVK